MSDQIAHLKAKLKEAGVENASNEFRWLTEHADQSGGNLAHLIERRIAGEPLQHIIGQTPFHAISLKTDTRALIPRSDSETVVELALDHLPDNRAQTLADLGAGTGALLLAVLAQRRHAKGTAVERSPEAASLLAENISALKMNDRANLFQGSWADWHGWGECNLILSNPPYIESSIIPTLAPDVRDYDPLEALDGGTDGLDAYREIIALGATRMKTGAWLVMEIGYDQRESVRNLLDRHDFSNLVYRKDLGGNDRAIAAQKP